MIDAPQVYMTQQTKEVWHKQPSRHQQMMYQYLQSLLYHYQYRNTNKYQVSCHAYQNGWMLLSPQSSPKIIKSADITNEVTPHVEESVILPSEYNLHLDHVNENDSVLWWWRSIHHHKHILLDFSHHTKSLHWEHHRSYDELDDLNELSLLEISWHTSLSTTHQQIRRALLTQKQEALLVQDVSCKDQSLAHLMTLQEVHQEHGGRVLYITNRVTHVQALAHTYLRGHEDFLICMDLESVLEELLANTQDENSGRQTKDVSELPYWARFQVWLVKNQEHAGPWIHYPHLLYYLLINRLWGNTHTQNQHTITWPSEWKDVDDVWKTSAITIAKKAQKTPLYDMCRIIKDMQKVSHWPWQNIKTVWIDQCLQYQWSALTGVLKIMHEYLSPQRTPWRLVLCSHEWQSHLHGGITWQAIRHVCQHLLERTPLTLKIHQSDTLSWSHVRAIQSCLPLYEGLPWSSRPQALSLSIYPKTHRSTTESAQTHQALHYTQVNAPSNQEEWIQLCSTVLATPNSFILDLSGGLSQFFQHVEWRHLLYHDLSLITLGLDELACHHIQHLYVYVGESYTWLQACMNHEVTINHHASSLPQSLSIIERRIAIDLFLLLLSHCTDTLTWLGTFQTNLHSEIKSHMQTLYTLTSSQLSPIEWSSSTLSHHLHHQSHRSPWYGFYLFQAVHHARALMSACDWLVAYKAWKHIHPWSHLLLGDEIYQESVAALSHIQNKALEVAIQAQVWQHAQALYLESTHVDEESSHWISAEIYDILDQSEEALEQENTTLLIDQLKALNGLEYFELAQFIYPLIEQRLWRWSVMSLQRSRPQAQVQTCFLSYLVRLFPQVKAYHILSLAYQYTTPKLKDLSVLTLQLLTHVSQSKKDIRHMLIHHWSLMHIARWLYHLLNHSSTQLKLKQSAHAIAYGFAYACVEQEEWSQGATFFALAQSLQKQSILFTEQDQEHVPLFLQKSKQDQEQEDQHVPLWIQHYQTQKQKQSLLSYRQQMRTQGDVSALFHSYQTEKEIPPTEIECAYQLYNNLKQIQSLWHLLNDAERETLQNLWQKLKHPV